MLLMIDNFDSFTYNLVQYLGELGQDVYVKRNNELDIAGIRKLNPQYIVLSPGPCTPDDAGICLEVVDKLGNEIPILGVCLGHQTIAQACGGKIVHAQTLMHGKTSMIHHTGVGVFTEISDPFQATRYHSLVAERASLPEELEVTAWTSDDEIMGVRHRSKPLQGVQFHPESILTQFGHQLLKNFLDQPA